MRRLWSDIDQARDSLGLGSSPANGASWSMLGVMGDAAALATDAAGALTAGAVDALRGALGTLPDPLRLVGSAVPCVRRLPIVGGLFSE